MNRKTGLNALLVSYFIYWIVCDTHGLTAGLLWCCADKSLLLAMAVHAHITQNTYVHVHTPTHNLNYTKTVPEILNYYFCSARILCPKISFVRIYQVKSLVIKSFYLNRQYLLCTFPCLTRFSLKL